MLLKDKLEGFNLILASGSPRRKQILAESGLPFMLAPAYEVDETYPADLPAEEVAEYLAALKSDAYPSSLGSKDILLTADTTVVLDGRVLGKPCDIREAVEMLERLSGHTHRVFTGVVLRSADKRDPFTAEKRDPFTAEKRDPFTPDKRFAFTVETTVHFRRLTAEEIAHYVDTFRPLDKAGAYGIQEWIGYVGIERIEGSFHNVMGMPMQKIYTELDKFIA